MANKGEFEQYSKKVFDETFEPLAYHTEGERLAGIQLVVRRGSDEYLLEVQTLGLHMERAALEEDDGESMNTGAETYVIASDEILPSDLANIKGMTIEQLEPYLELQEN